MLFKYYISLNVFFFPPTYCFLPSSLLFPFLLTSSLTRGIINILAALAQSFTVPVASLSVCFCGSSLDLGCVRQTITAACLVVFCWLLSHTETDSSRCLLIILEEVEVQPNTGPDGRPLVHAAAGAAGLRPSSRSNVEE